MAIREDETEEFMEGLDRKGAKVITRDDMAEKLKKYVKRLSDEKLLESYRFATIVECFGQISEFLREEGYEDASYELMDTANKITDTMILTVLESTEIKKEKKWNIVNLVKIVYQDVLSVEVET